MPHSTIVGALACQKDSYLRTLDAEVVSCVKVSTPPVSKKSKPKNGAVPEDLEALTLQDLWEVEFTDSVLFPEGGGQPTDYGTVTPISGAQSDVLSVTNVQRHGLRCVYQLPKPLQPGTQVRQDIDSNRRWNHMQQHTGEHMLSAIIDKTNDLRSLGWGIGSDETPNYVDLPRKPTEYELETIQDECNRVIRENLSIKVEYPENPDVTKIPDDYDTSRGVVRAIRIGDLDTSPCCGTHLRQTSHIGMIMLLHSQPIAGKRCRLFFFAGDRAIKAATKSMMGMRSIANLVSSPSNPDDVLNAVARLKDNAGDLRKRETKLLQVIARYEADAAQPVLQRGENIYIYRPDLAAEFVNLVVSAVSADAVENAILVVAAGEVGTSGQLVAIGKSVRIEDFVKKVTDAGIEVKGGGKGGRWQGKVVRWKKGELEALEKLVQS